MEKLKTEITINELLKNEKISLTELSRKTSLSIPLLSKIKNNQIMISKETQDKFNTIYENYKLKNKYTNQLEQSKDEITILKAKLLKLEKENFILNKKIENYKTKYTILFETLKELKE